MGGLSLETLSDWCTKVLTTLIVFFPSVKVDVERFPYLLESARDSEFLYESINL